MLKPLSKPFARLALRYGDRAGQAGPSQADQAKPNRLKDTDTFRAGQRYRYIESAASCAEMGNRIDAIRYDIRCWLYKFS